MNCPKCGNKMFLEGRDRVFMVCEVCKNKIISIDRKSKGKREVSIYHKYIPEEEFDGRGIA